MAIRPLEWMPDGSDDDASREIVAPPPFAFEDDAEPAAMDDAPAFDVDAENVRARAHRPQPRAHTVSLKRMSKRELARGEVEYPASINAAAPRPRTYGECAARGLGGEVPCPYVSCKQHLYLDVNPRTGSIKLNFPDREPDDLEQTCALRVAELGGITLEETGEIMNLTRERIRQLETRGLAKLHDVTPPLESLVNPDRRPSEALAATISVAVRRHDAIDDAELEADDG